MRVYSGHQNVSNLMRKLLDDASDFHLIHAENERNITHPKYAAPVQISMYWAISEIRTMFIHIWRFFYFFFSLESYSTSYSN